MCLVEGARVVQGFERREGEVVRKVLCESAFSKTRWKYVMLPTFRPGCTGLHQGNMYQQRVINPICTQSLGMEDVSSHLSVPSPQDGSWYWWGEGVIRPAS